MQFLSRQNCLNFQTCSKSLRYRGNKSQWKSHLVYTCDFAVATLSATNIASSCYDKYRLCKRAFTVLIKFQYWPKLHQESNKTSLIIYSQKFKQINRHTLKGFLSSSCKCWWMWSRRSVSMSRHNGWSKCWPKKKKAITTDESTLVTVLWCTVIQTDLGSLILVQITLKASTLCYTGSHCF